MGVDEEGKLVPMKGLEENPLAEETKSELEDEAQSDKEDKDWNMLKSLFNFVFLHILFVRACHKNYKTWQFLFKHNHSDRD